MSDYIASNSHKNIPIKNLWILGGSQLKNHPVWLWFKYEYEATIKSEIMVSLAEDVGTLHHMTILHWIETFVCLLQRHCCTQSNEVCNSATLLWSSLTEARIRLNARIGKIYHLKKSPLKLGIYRRYATVKVSLVEYYNKKLNSGTKGTQQLRSLRWSCTITRGAQLKLE